MEQNYLPLFRKYRPQSFKDIVGQEHLVKALTNAIELNRIANAYLFCGPRGTGKTSTARILAKSLNCKEGPTINPCQKCASCVDITNATGLDVIEIDAASNRGIQDAKDLISQVQYAPINGKYKIFIIDEVHMLSNDAFNALLKTFEEPPENVIFILATTEPHKVLETIISRCQRFDLKRITTDDIIKRLREISDIENIKISDDALFTIAKNVSGGLRDSLALLDQVSILGAKEEITKELIEELIGKINFDILLELLKNINDEDIEKAITSVDTIYSKGNEPRNLAENFIEFIRNVILVINSKNSETIKNFTTLIDNDIEKIKACDFDKDKISKILNIMIDYYKEIKVSTNPYLWMELATISSCKLEINSNTQIQTQSQIQKPTIQNVAMNIQAPIIKKPQTQPIQTQTEVKAAEVIEPKIQAQPNTQPQTNIQNQVQTNTIVPPEIAQNQDSAQIWSNIVNSIASIPARALFSGLAKLVGIKDKELTLGFLNDNTLNQAKSPAKYSLLENAVKSTYPDLTLNLIRINQDTKVIATKPQIVSRPAIHQQAPQQQAQNPVTKTVQDEKKDEDSEEQKNKKKNYSSKVQNMLEEFNGKIIE